MAAQFDASSYFTKGQADNRYVKAPLTAQEILYLLGSADPTDPTLQGIIPGGMIEFNSITGSQIQQGAIDLSKLYDGLSAVVTIIGTPPSYAMPAFYPSTPYKEGQVIYFKNATSMGLYTAKSKTDGTLYWDNTVPAANITGQLVNSQVADGLINTAKLAQTISAINVPVTSLPTIQDNPIGSGTNWNYNVNDIVTLMVSGSQPVLYKLDSTRQWRLVIAGQAGTERGTLSTSLLYADWITAGVISAAAIKANQVDIHDLVVTGLGAFNNLVSLTVTSNSVSTATFVSGSVTTDALAANSVTAGKIASAAVSTNNLIVGSFDNLMEDPTFDIQGPGDSARGWTAYADNAYSWKEDGQGLKIYASWGRDGTYGLIKQYGGGWPSTAASSAVNRMVFDVKPPDSSGVGDTLYLEAWAGHWSANGSDVNSGSSANVVVSYYKDQACTIPVTAAGTYSLVWTLANSPAGYSFKQAQLTVPALARWARISIQVLGQSSGLWAFDEIYLIKATPSAYISSLDATVIQAAFATVGQLDCTTFNVVHMKANAIDSGTLNCTNLVVANINGQAGPFNLSGGLPGSAITNLSITNAQIANATITSAKIQSLTADLITTGTLVVGTNVTVAGTINAANVNLINLNAANITAGVLKVGGSSFTQAPDYVSVLNGSDVLVAWIGNVGSQYGIWSQNAWIGGTGPSDAPIVASAAGVALNNVVINLSRVAPSGSYTVTSGAILSPNSFLQLTETYRYTSNGTTFSNGVNTVSASGLLLSLSAGNFGYGLTTQYDTVGLSVVASNGDSISLGETSQGSSPNFQLSITAAGGAQQLQLSPSTPNGIQINGRVGFTGTILDSGGTSHDVINGLIVI